MLSKLEPPKIVRFQRGAVANAGVPSVTEQLFSNLDGTFKAGFWSSEPNCVPISYEKDELCVLLEGTVALTDEAGNTETYRKGDTFMIPRGFKGTWETIEPAQKFYAVSI